MTEPTGRPPADPTRPTDPDPPAGAPAGASPAYTWEAPAPAAVQPHRGRSGLADAAGVILIVLGVLVLLFAVLSLFLSTMASQVVEGAGGALPPGFPGSDVIGQAFAILGVIVLIIGVLYLLAGIGVLRRSGAGRWGGIVLGVLGALLTLPGGTQGAGSDGGGALLSILIVAAHIFVVIALAVRWHPAAPRPV